MTQKANESIDIFKMDYLSNAVLDAPKMKMLGCAHLGFPLSPQKGVGENPGHMGDSHKNVVGVK